MEMNLAPLAVPSMPYTCLFHRAAGELAAGICVLREASVGDDANVTQHSDVRSDDGGLRGSAFLLFGEEVEVMEIEPIDQVATCLRLKTGQRWIDQCLIELPVASRYGSQQPLRTLQNLLPLIHISCRHQIVSPLFLFL